MDRLKILSSVKRGGRRCWVLCCRSARACDSVRSPVLATSWSQLTRHQAHKSCSAWPDRLPLTSLSGPNSRRSRASGLVSGAGSDSAVAVRTGCPAQRQAGACSRHAAWRRSILQACQPTAIASASRQRSGSARSPSMTTRWPRAWRLAPADGKPDLSRTGARRDGAATARP